MGWKRPPSFRREWRLRRNSNRHFSCKNIYKFLFSDFNCFMFFLRFNHSRNIFSLKLHIFFSSKFRSFIEIKDFTIYLDALVILVRFIFLWFRWNLWENSLWCANGYISGDSFSQIRFLFCILLLVRRGEFYDRVASVRDCSRIWGVVELELQKNINHSRLPYYSPQLN